MSAADDLRWFMSHQDDVPGRIHVRGLWRVPPDEQDAGKGSRIGSPAIAQEFARWMEWSPRATIIQEVEEPCLHPGRAIGARCGTCAIRDEGGRIIAETGVRKTTREFYRWPMRAALASIHGAPIAAGMPRLDVTLRAIARQGGDVRRAIAMLAYPCPPMGDPDRALAHVRRALGRVREVYVLEPLHLPLRRKSDAQLDAEAA
jgi:hypothetical protein